MENNEIIFSFMETMNIIFTRDDEVEETISSHKSVTWSDIATTL